MVLSLLLLLASRSAALHVEGNLMVENGRPVTLRGVNIPSLEWSNEGEFVFRSARVAFEDWHANCIRLPLSEDRWFGKADKQADNGESYQEAVDEVVNLATNRDRYIIVDLHWTDMGVWGKEIGQHQMPDDHAIQFWRDLAYRYRALPHVLFDLYNEPHDVSWNVWRDGGEVQEKGLQYHTPGMQALVDAIRKTHATNVCVAGGLDWAYDLTGVVNGFALRDPEGKGIVYDTHIYPWKGDWEGKVGVACSANPVIVGEMGCVPKDSPSPEVYAPKMFDFISKHQLSWTAWCFHPTALPNLIGDWLYTSTTFWGTIVKRELSDSATNKR
jgi:hypothetical protein